MREKRWYILLTVEAVFCLLFYTAKMESGNVLSAILAFPFEQIGASLRFLSLNGSLGNALALTIYTAIALIPVWYLLHVVQKRGFQWEDSLLVVLSVLLFLVVYWMINPGIISSMFPVGETLGMTVEKAILGCTVYSVLGTYLVLRILRLFFESRMEQLNQWLSSLLKVLNVIFVWAIFGGCFGSLIEALKTLKDGNVGNEAALEASYIILGLRFVVEALPYALDILTVFMALKLIEVMRKEQYSEDTIISANQLSRWCAKALAIVMISNMGMNLIQLIFIKELRNTNSNLSIPIVSVAFVLAVLLVARMIEENRRLKGDNDLFI